MKVIRLFAPGDLRLLNENTEEPGPGENLVRVTSVGICGSDLHWFSDAGIGDARLEKPLILGHEFAGVIAEGPRKGERVAIDPAVPCMTCEDCLKGNPNLCTAMRFAGHGSVDGALREFIAWPTGCLHHLPDSLSDSDGAMLEPLGVALHAIDLGKLRVGMTVGIFGAGPIGLLILQLAHLSGAKVMVVTDKLSHRLTAARALGATQTVLAGTSSSGQEMTAILGRGGVDVAFEVAGENEAVENAFAAARPGGHIILVGIPADDRTSFSASIARRKGLSIRMVRRMKYTYPRAIQLVESGQVDVRSLVTHHFPLEQSLQAFSLAQKREGLKVVVEC